MALVFPGMEPVGGIDMALPTAYEAYRTTQVKTSSPADLLLLLYDGAIKWCQKAVIHLNSGDGEAAHQALLKSQDIISELMISLDFAAGEEIAQGLYQLYDYMYSRLVEANIKKEEELVAEVVGMLQEMREMWGQVAKQVQYQGLGTTGGLDIVK